MTHPTITKDQAVRLALVTKLLSDGFCVSDSDAASIHTFAQAAYKLGRNAGLEDARQTAEDCDVVEAKGNTYYAQCGDAAATQRAIVAAIESLKDNT